MAQAAAQRDLLAVACLLSEVWHCNKWNRMSTTQADRQEALVKAEQRRLALERANKMLFDETDDVKGLHGKLQLSEVRYLPWIAVHRLSCLITPAVQSACAHTA